jgi:hypothetical protein
LRFDLIYQFIIKRKMKSNTQKRNIQGDANKPSSNTPQTKKLSFLGSLKNKFFKRRNNKLPPVPPRPNRPLPLSQPSNGNRKNEPPEPPPRPNRPLPPPPSVRQHNYTDTQNAIRQFYANKEREEQASRPLPPSPSYSPNPFQRSMFFPHSPNQSNNNNNENNVSLNGSNEFNNVPFGTVVYKGTNKNNKKEADDRAEELKRASDLYARVNKTKFLPQTSPPLPPKLSGQPPQSHRPTPEERLMLLEQAGQEFKQLPNNTKTNPFHQLEYEGQLRQPQLYTLPLVGETEHSTVIGGYKNKKKTLKKYKKSQSKSRKHKK